jgi:hypothetical protein
MAKCLKKKSQLKTNSFPKERTNSRHYCFFFDRKLFKNIPPPLGQTMSSLVCPRQISSTACCWSFQFSGVATFSSVSSFVLDLCT